jgi:hypothetical protein
MLQPASTSLSWNPASWLDRLVGQIARRIGRGANRAVVDYALAAVVGGAGLLLYVITLAPTLTWGDDATLQLAAVQGRFQASAGSHPAWVLLAHLFTRLPVGDLAYRVNLASAFAAALTLGLLYLACRAANASRFASLTATVAFAVSHTFWAHAVRTEVYTLTLATLALVTWAALQWLRLRQRQFLILMAAGWSLAFSTHVLALLYLPALACLLLMQRNRLRGRDWALMVGSALLALAPYSLVLWFDYQRMGGNLLTLARWALFTFDGYDFSGQMAGFSLATLPSDTAQWAGFLGYQFIGLGLPLVGLGLLSAWRHWPRALTFFIGLLYVVPAGFAFAYQVGDRYVFYLPSYLPVVIWLAAGIDGWQQWQRARAGQHLAGRVNRQRFRLALLVLLVLVPVGVYRLTPELVGRLGVQREARYVPGPNSRYFVLWPPKTNYYDARTFAESALNSAPPDALLLADPTLASPMFFLQQVERLRPDIRVRFCCWDIEQALTAGAGRPIALADNATAIYPIDQLQREYDIIPHGSIYLLMPARQQALSQPPPGSK